MNFIYNNRERCSVSTCFLINIKLMGLCIRISIHSSGWLQEQQLCFNFFHLLMICKLASKRCSSCNYFICNGSITEIKRGSRGAARAAKSLRWRV